MVVVTVAVALGAAVPPAGAWSDLDSSQRLGGYSSDRASAGLAVADGRVWWLEGQYGAFRQPKGFVLASKGLRDGKTRRVVLAADAMPQPSPANGVTFPMPNAETVRIRGGQAAVSGIWAPRQLSPDMTGLVGPAFIAAFDRESGALVRYASPDSARGEHDPRLVDGNPAVLRFPTSPGTQVLSDPVTGKAFPVRLSYGEAAQVAGQYLLTLPPGPSGKSAEESWSGGRGTLRVRELATGRLRYRLSVRQVRRAAGVRGRPPVRVTLNDDGSLAVMLGTYGRTTRPVAVDARGRVRRIGRPVVGAWDVSALVGHRRAFVFVGRRSTEDRRDGLWITDTAGKRGRSLPVVDRVGASRALPFSWDGTYAVWTTATRRDKRGIRVDHGLRRLRLRSTTIPSNWHR